MANGVTDFLHENIGTIGAGVGGAAVGAGVGVVATSAYYRSKARKRRKSKSRSVRKRTSRYKTKRSKKRHVRRTPRTAGKRKDTSHRRIRQTKNGQPYIILANGRARFIKKSSARKSRKLKGGKY